MFFIDWLKQNRAITTFILLLFFGNLLFFSLMKYGYIDSANFYSNVALSADSSIVLKKPLSFFVWYLFHTSVLHLVLNCVAFCIAVIALVAAMGQKKTLFLFFAANLFSGLVFLLISHFLPSAIYLVGMSAGVFAVFSAAVLTLPQAALSQKKITLLIAILYGSLFILSTDTANVGGNIAHLSGALFGWMYAVLHSYFDVSK